MNKSKTVYFKGLDANLQGHGGFQYEIGKTYASDTPDPWRWLYFTSHIETAMQYGRRIVEVEPATRVCRMFGNNDLCAQSIRVVRELSKEEILMLLVLRPIRKKDVRCCLRRMGWI